VSALPACPATLNLSNLQTGEVVFVLLGVLFQGASLLSEAVRLTLVQLLLQQRGFKLNPISTMYHISPVCFMALLIPLATLEAEKVRVCRRDRASFLWSGQEHQRTWGHSLNTRAAAF
jgi:hypothetical protein